MQIPLPPLAEIDRIVVRLDELMTLCDQLDRNLVAAYGTRSRLLNTLLFAEALRDFVGRHSRVVPRRMHPESAET